MTFRPSRHAVALGVAVLVVGSVTSTVSLLSRPLESTASPALTQPDRPVDAAAAEPAPAPVDVVVAEPAEAPAPAPAVEDPASAAPAPRLDPARLAGGPVAGRPDPDPSLDGARFRVGEAGFFTSLSPAQRDDYPALAEVWREKGDAWGWRMPDYSRIVASANGTGGSRPPKVDYDARFAAALGRIGGGRPGGFGPDIYSQIHPQGLVGVTTWYGDDFHGLVMRYGEIYDMFDPTIAACNVYPGGTRLRVTASNGRYVDVTVKDTGAFQYPIVTDLSWAAFAQLGDPDWGVIDVVVEPLDQLPPEVIAAYGPPQAPFKTPPPAGGLVGRPGASASPSPVASPRAAGASASPVASPAPAIAPRYAVPTPTPPATPTPAPTEPAASPTASPTPVRTPTRAATPTALPTATTAPAPAPAQVAPSQPIVPVPIATAAPTRTPTPAPPTATPRPTNTPLPLPTATPEADRPTGAPPVAQPTAPKPPAAPSPAAPPAPGGNRDGG